MKKTILDYDVENKKVIIRSDLNVPLQDGVITDDTRIRASVKTISYVLENGGSVILLSHLGKVKQKEDMLKNDLKVVAKRLSELLGIEVKFSKSTRGRELEDMATNLKAGEVLLIQNTRYEDIDGKKESSCDLALAKYWASLGDIFINDAYGTSHRSHASNVGIAKFLPNGLGFLVLDEVSKLDSILNANTHPFIVIMGGAKVSDKIKVIENLILKCDKILIGGGMAYTFLKAQGYNIGKSLLEDDYLDFCRKILDKFSEKVVLPIDNVVSDSLESNCYENKENKEIEDNDICFDIGVKTRELFKANLQNAKRVIVNGPMGVFEHDIYSQGTKEIYDYITNNKIKTLVGGGDSAFSVNKLSDSSKFYHISTGGGATLEYLEGKELPGISVIDEKV